MFFVFDDWRGGRDEFKYRTLFVGIIFHARIFYSVNRLFFISFPNSPSSSKKEGPLFQSFFLSFLFLVLLLVLQRVPHPHYRCLVLPRTNPQTMPTGQAQRLTLRPTPVSTPFSIPVCFRSQTRPAYRLVPLPSLSSPVVLGFTAGAAESPPKRGRGRPKGSKNKKSGTSTTEATGEEPPKRKRGRPPKARIILISSTCRVPSSHHSSFPYSLSHRERRRRRVQIPHPNVNAAVLPRIPSRTPMKTPIMSSLLNLAQQRRRGGQVGPARSQTIDTTTVFPIFEAITIAPRTFNPPCTGPLCP